MKHDDVGEAGYDSSAVKAAEIEIAFCGAGRLALSVWENIDTYFSARASISRSGHAPVCVRVGSWQASARRRADTTAA